MQESEFFGECDPAGPWATPHVSRAATPGQYTALSAKAATGGRKVPPTLHVSDTATPGVRKTDPAAGPEHPDVPVGPESLTHVVHAGSNVPTSAADDAHEAAASKKGGREPEAQCNTEDDAKSDSPRRPRAVSIAQQRELSSPTAF